MTAGCVDDTQRSGGAVDRTLDGVVILRSRSPGCERGRAEPAPGYESRQREEDQGDADHRGFVAADVSDGRPKHELGQSERGEGNHARREIQGLRAGWGLTIIGTENRSKVGRRLSEKTTQTPFPRHFRLVCS